MLAVAACSSPDTGGNGKAEPAGVAANADKPVGAATSIPAADSKFIVVFGDSLFAGYNLGADEGFAPALERVLNAAGTKASVFNAGVSGDTTAAGAQRLAFTLDGLPRKPDLVIVGLGGNDMLRGLDAAQTRQNLESIVAQLKQRGIAVMLSGMVAAPNLGPDYAAEFNPIYADLARKHDLPLYPFFLDGVITDRSLMLPDGIHPNANGVEVVAGRMEPLVRRSVTARD